LRSIVRFFSPFFLFSLFFFFVVRSAEFRNRRIACLKTRALAIT
jgi:hypothetical protein